MRDQAARADSRSVTITMSDTVYTRLVEQARKFNRTPSARATELFMAAFAAHFGPTGDRELDAVVKRLNSAALAGTAKPQAVVAAAPAPAAPPAPPPPAAPPVPAPERPERPPSQRDIMKAALSDRGRALVARLGLTATEAGVIDIMLDGNLYTPSQLRGRLPASLSVSSDFGLQVMFSRMRRKVPLSYEELQNLPGRGYQLSAPCRARLEAAIKPAGAAP